MFTVTLISSPDDPKLNDVMVNGLCRKWDGDATTWLAPGEAASFTVAVMPDDLENQRQNFHEAGVDLVVVPGQAKAKSLLLADMDCTMIEQECIDELAELAGVGDHVRAVTTRAMNGELDFEQALDERVALMAGHSAELISKVINDRITLKSGGRALLATMNAHGTHTVLISGGFTQFANHVAGTLGFDDHYANDLVVEDGHFTGEVTKPVVDRNTKYKTLMRYVQERSLDLQDTMAVGDGANDLGMLKAAGLGVALHAKPIVAQQCDARINHGDLTALLYLQGFRRDQFVSAV